MLEKDWDAIGRWTLAQLPEHEHYPFIDWLQDAPGVWSVYEDSAEEALRLWRDHLNMQLPEGF
jgi:hypothetical protein